MRLIKATEDLIKRLVLYVFIGLLQVNNGRRFSEVLILARVTF